MDYDTGEELAELDTRLSETESQLRDAEMLVWEIQKEWDEVYPYDILEWSLSTIENLAERILELDPNNLQAKEIIEEAHNLIPPAMEPEVFHLR